MTVEALPPRNWKQMDRVCMSRGDYLLWKTEFVKQCQATANINQAQQISITVDMLARKAFIERWISN